MRSVDDEISIEVDRIRGAGHYDELNIIPIVEKKCFLYCGIGYCNCQATVAGKYCVVVDAKVAGAQQEFLNELSFLESKINKV